MDLTQELVRRAVKAAQVMGHTATLKGVVLFDDGIIQTIRTDSRIHPIVKCAGPTYISGARRGDHVQLWYKIDEKLRYGMWTGRVVRRD